ncbi:MAG TPA: hypothetical protein VFT43_05130 [Candidatus Polarisedimenticolia bacterium]|nr:hypothetical protein [Candidatus Polarisedimenticolia bacterium]
MRVRLSAWLLFGLPALSLSCSDTTPAKINFTAPPAVIVSGKAVALDAVLVNKKGEPLSRQRVTYSAAPAELIEVSAAGALRCLKTGDGTVTLTGGGLSSEVAAKCRIPAEIALPRDLQLVLGSAPVALHARALGEGGREMKDVPVPVTSSDPAVVTVDGDKVRPVAVGRARLRAALEEIIAVTPVEVVEKIASERLVLADGAHRSFALKEGDYLVTIEVTPDVRANQGVTVSWEGAGCENQPEQQSHRFTCKVRDTATLTVTNPRQMGLGARLSGPITILRVPAS